MIKNLKRCFNTPKYLRTEDILLNGINLALYKLNSLFITSLLAKEIFLGTNICRFRKQTFPTYSRTYINLSLPIRGFTKLFSVVSATLWQIWETRILNFSETFTGTIWVFWRSPQNLCKKSCIYSSLNFFSRYQYLAAFIWNSIVLYYL